MGATTPTYALPYPASTDPPDGPAQIRALAEQSEVVHAATDEAVGDVDDRVTALDTATDTRLDAAESALTALDGRLDAVEPAAAGVPAGGTVGQVLTKTGAANYATIWAPPATSGLYNPAQAPLTSGFWMIAGHPGAPAGATWGLNAGQANAWPLAISTAATFSDIGISGSGSSTGTLRLGLYASDTAGQPAALIRALGVFSGATADGQFRNTALAPALALTPGLYWMFALSDVAQVTLRTSAATSPYCRLGTPGTATPGGDPYPSIPQASYYWFGVTTGSLPANLPPVRFFRAEYPHIWLKLA